MYAHAVLQEQTHVVRYHSAWEQDGHMIIQNEYCDGQSFISNDVITLSMRYLCPRLIFRSLVCWRMLLLS